MSHAELMSLVDRSTEEERLFLAAYLRHVARKDDPEHLKKLSESHQKIENGEKINLLELKNL